MSTALQFPYLDFWSRFHFTGGEQGQPIKLEIIQKADKLFKPTSTQPQDQNNVSNSIKEELKTPDIINYTKQDDATVDGFKTNYEQITISSYENRQNSSSSTKEASPLRRSERIAKRKLNSPSSMEASSSKKQCLLPIKLQIGAQGNAFYHLNYGLQSEKQKA